MSDLSFDVAWREIIRETEEGIIPHCRAIAASSELHEEIIYTLADIILESYRPNHPDLLIIGTTDKAPSIELCRNLISDIALKPLEAPLRLGVIMCADRLLLPAANSLLKLSEEPPEHAVLLFLMEDMNHFLPTLKSRSICTVLVPNDRTEIAFVPNIFEDWIKWLAKTYKAKDVSSIVNDLGGWIFSTSLKEDYELAGKIDRLRIIADKKNLPVPLLCDLIILTLGEEYKYCEDILDDLR